MTLDNLKTLFANDLYATEVTGIEILEADTHFARCGLVVQRKHRNAMGAVMGGVMCTLADFAFAVAANSEALEWVTMESTIHYLSAVPSERLTATTQCIKQGGRTCFYEIAVTNEQGHLLATVTTSGMRVK